MSQQSATSSTCLLGVRNKLAMTLSLETKTARVREVIQGHLLKGEEINKSWAGDCLLRTVGMGRKIEREERKLWERRQVGNA